MDTIRVAIVGVGNCASSLVQGVTFYRDRFDAEWSDPREAAVGLAHPTLGGYAPGNVEFVAAFDIDARKVGRPLHEAIFAAPNNTTVFCDEVRCDVPVRMGHVLDGIADHMAEYPEHQRFVVADQPNADHRTVVRTLRETGTEILLNYLPVGSQAAAEFYAECCLDAGVSLINCIPVFIVSNPKWAERFRKAGIPCVGDDIKAQVGATITHRMLAHMMEQRGARVDATYQLNTAGNTDFLNMLERRRLGSKKVSKTEAVQSQLDVPLDPDQIHIGPADYVPWQKDNKLCFLRIEARGFGGVPLHIEARLSVEDSPNSAGECIDAIRCCRLARDTGLAGPLEAVSAWTMKHPPVQHTDALAYEMLEDFITEATLARRRGRMGAYAPDRDTADQPSTRPSAG